MRYSSISCEAPGLTLVKIIFQARVTTVGHLRIFRGRPRRRFRGFRKRGEMRSKSCSDLLLCIEAKEGSEKR